MGYHPPPKVYTKPRSHLSKMGKPFEIHGGKCLVYKDGKIYCIILKPKWSMN